MKKLVVPIAGMHCRSCEILIEDKLSEVPEIKKSYVNYKRGIAEISYEIKPGKLLMRYTRRKGMSSHHL
jgi:copper chaperone CopZ